MAPLQTGGGDTVKVFPLRAEGTRPGQGRMTSGKDNSVASSRLWEIMATRSLYYMQALQG